MAEFQTPNSGSSSIPSVARSRFSRVQRWALTNAMSAIGLSGRLASTLGSEVVPSTLAVVSTSQSNCSASGKRQSSRYSTSTMCSRPSYPGCRKARRPGRSLGGCGPGRRDRLQAVRQWRILESSLQTTLHRDPVYGTGIMQGLFRPAPTPPEPGAPSVTEGNVLCSPIPVTWLLRFYSRNLSYSRKYPCKASSAECPGILNWASLSSNYLGAGRTQPSYDTKPWQTRMKFDDRHR